jgi:hypothetical protein
MYKKHTNSIDSYSLDPHSNRLIPKHSKGSLPHHGDPWSQAPQDDLCGRNGSQGHSSIYNWDLNPSAESTL